MLEVNITNSHTELIRAKLYLHEDINSVKIELHFNNTIISCSEENYFSALVQLREILELNNLYLLCKGCERDVYPSHMQISMGLGRKAYKLTMGQQALQEDIVDIFSIGEINRYVTIHEQEVYFEEWIKSLK